MRVVSGMTAVAVLVGLAGCVAGAADGKDRAKETLKPNQVLLKVPGMH